MLSDGKPPSRAWQVIDVIDIGDAPQRVRKLAEHVLAKHAIDWSKIACTALVRDFNGTDERDYLEWLVAVEAPVLRHGDVLHSTGEWSSNRLRAVGDINAPGGSRVVLDLSVCERVSLSPSG